MFKYRMSFVPFAEEILHTSPALSLSNDGHLLLYAVFNDTSVNQQRFTSYGTNGNGKEHHLYPEIVSLR